MVVAIIYISLLALCITETGLFQRIFDVFHRILYSRGRDVGHPKFWGQSLGRRYKEK